MTPHADLTAFAQAVKAAETAFSTKTLTKRQALTTYELLATYFRRKAEGVRFPNRAQ